MVDLDTAYKGLWGAVAAAQSYVELVEPGDHGPAAILACTLINQMGDALHDFEYALRQTGWTLPVPAPDFASEDLQ
ncbi:MAG: hypothetical protein V4738_11070 [Pseudomonadota bacterium]